MIDNRFQPSELFDRTREREPPNAIMEDVLAGVDD